MTGTAIRGYLEELSHLKAEWQLLQAMAASYPYMKESDGKHFIQSLQREAYGERKQSKAPSPLVLRRMRIGLTIERLPNADESRGSRT